MTPAVLDHLLRTMASVPVGGRVLDVATKEGEHVIMLRSLGFEVTVTDDPGGMSPAFFEWATSLEQPTEDVVERFQAVRRALVPGGWLFCSVRAETANPSTVLDLIMREAGFVESESPGRSRDNENVAHGIFRRVDEHTVG
jgi:hypothetical protein